MSLGLFAAIVVELERRAAEVVPVDELARYAAVQPEAVRAVLLDMHAQGHCDLVTDLGQITAAQWLPEVPCA